MGKTQALRVAILVDSTMIQAWVYQSITYIQELDRVKICCVLVDPVKNDGIAFSPLQKRLKKLLGKFFDGDINGPDYRQRETIKNLLTDVPIQVVGDVGDVGDKVKGEEDIDRHFSILKDQQADVLIKYAHHVLANQTALELTYGVWDHVFNHSAFHRPGYEGFWETLLSQPEVGSSLQVTQAQLATQSTLFPSYSCTHEASVYGTNNLNYWKSSLFAVRALKIILHQGSEDFFSRLGSKQNCTAQSAPSNVQYAALLAKKIIFKVIKKIKYKRYFEQWFLLYQLNPDSHALEDMSRFVKLLPPKEVFWADPHVVFENNQYYLFIEELPFATNKGYLSVIEMDTEGNYSEPKKILEKDYHLSYPNVFNYQGEYYMIPETFDNFTIELYKCVNFPYQWEFVMNLMEGLQAVDTTLHFQDNKCWLFTNIMENPGASPHDELFLFYTEGDFLTTQWTPHPLNPIVSDVKTARPAGKIYTENGKIYRPSQNCSHHYGYGVNINEITLLSETKYEERLITQVEPDWDKEVIATHSYSKVKDLVVMDGIILRKK